MSNIPLLDEKNKGETYEWVIEKADQMMTFCKVGKYVRSMMFKLQGISWVINFYMRGEDDLPEDELSSSIRFVSLNRQPENFKFSIQIDNYEHTITHDSPAICSRSHYWGFSRLMPWSKLRNCVNQENEVIIKVTIIKV